MRAIPRPRLIRRASIQLTAGLSVPTMSSATTSTRNTGQSRISSHSPATARINWMIVAGGISRRTVCALAFGGTGSGSGGELATRLVAAPTPPTASVDSRSRFTFMSSSS